MPAVTQCRRAKKTNPARGLFFSVVFAKLENMQIKEIVTKEYLKQLPDMRVGDTVRVHQKIKEGDKERVQIFEGIVIAMKHGKDISGTFCVRKIISGIGVEKTYPLHSPNIARIEVVSRAKIRQAKLYYLRDKVGKKAKLKRKIYVPGEETIRDPEIAEAPTTTEEKIEETPAEETEAKPTDEKPVAEASPEKEVAKPEDKKQ